MASGTLGGDESRERLRWGDASKVYTRKNFKKGPKNNNATTVADAANTTTAGSAACGDDSTAPARTVVPTTTANVNEDDSGENIKDKNNDNSAPQQNLQTLRTEEANSSQQQQQQPQRTVSPVGVLSDDSSSHNPPPQISAPNGSCEPLPKGNGSAKPIISRVDNRVRINLAAATSKNEIRELRRKLASELDQVRNLVKKIEEKEVQFTGYSINADATGYSHSQYSANHGVTGRSLVRVNSEVGYMGSHDSGPFRQIRISVMENNHGAGEFIEKEKRTPKANQYYRNSEFLLGKDRLPPAESNKKLKSSGAKKHGRQIGYGFIMDSHTNQALKSCNNLVCRLLKHKYGWVFEKPVDAKALGLHDYHDTIKHPMDLGTVKGRLARNLYKSPREFAEDVRLTFSNAMAYNPKGQDVHFMAEELLKIFEEKYADIEAEYNLRWRYELVHDVGLHTPTSRKVHPPPLPLPAFPMRTLDRTQSMTMPLDPKLKPIASVGRIPAPKKPKAKDPDKRDMTYEEKQKLSTNLQSLPSDKLDNIVQIIKKRNSALSQHDDEIEVDIDSVDAETLWELDRFVTNYKKSLSKNKRKAERALQAKAEAAAAIPAMNTAPVVVETAKESKIDDRSMATSPVQGGAQGDNVNRSSSSSSSSSDSGSSSSDSDSDSSSAYGSDAGHSPRT